jgi:hypothetical protein
MIQWTLHLCLLMMWSLPMLSSASFNALGFECMSRWVVDVSYARWHFLLWSSKAPPVLKSELQCLTSMMTHIKLNCRYCSDLCKWLQQKLIQHRYQVHQKISIQISLQ